MTATVETVVEQLDVATLIPTEHVVSALARSITVSDTDVATATVQVSQPQLLGATSTSTSYFGSIDPSRFADQDGGGATNGSMVADELVDSADDSNDSGGGHKSTDGQQFWQTSVGKFKNNLDSLPQTLQYIYQLLTELPTIEKPDILYYMLQCLKTLALHGDVLSLAANQHRGFFLWCQENLLIQNLWELCNAEHSHIAEASVPLLLHCITLPLGSDVFWRIVQEAFHDSDWRVRFTAVERVTVITRFMDSTPLRSEVGLQTALATAFCHLVASMDDISVYVAQRATLYLGTIHDKAITSLLFCLESQFDLFIVDRPVVLQSLYQLHNSLSDRRVLSWDFFLNRFDTLFVEAQVNLEKSGDLACLRDLRNSDNGSEVLFTKISKAREALSQSDTFGGAGGGGGAAGGGGVGGAGMAKTLSASFGPKWPYKRTMSAPASIIPRQESKVVYTSDKEKIYNRQTSAPILKRKTSRFGLDGNIYNCGGGAQDEANLTGCLHRIIDLEESDKETIHLLVFLFMQFLSRSDLAFPPEEKTLVKIQGIVLSHLYLLLGYSHIEKNFHVSASHLRLSAVFNVFLSNLQQVLDQNHHMGWTMLPTVFQILLYAPSPTMVATNGAESTQNISYTFSLWNLDAHPRRNWLMSVLVIMYKYQYTQPPYSGNINNIIRIVLNSLESHFHQCKRIPSTVMMDYLPPSRSRDVSQPSLGGTDRGDDPDGVYSPPPSPMYSGADAAAAYSSNGGIRAKHLGAFGSKPTARRYQDSSLDADETESELVVIPESDLSDSTINRSSAPESFDESCHFDDITPQQPADMFMNKTAQASSLNLAQLAMSTLGVADSSADDAGGGTHFGGTKLMFHKKGSASVDTPSSAKSNMKCSLQEGVRMMVTPSLFMRGASPSRDEAVVAKPAEPMPSTSSAAAAKDTKTSKVVHPPAALPLPGKKDLPKFEPLMQFDTVESPLSKMNILPNTAAYRVVDKLVSPTNVAHLEYPTPERLLPIGPQPVVQPPASKDGEIAALVDKVREALAIPRDVESVDAQQPTTAPLSPGPVTSSSLRGSPSPRRLRKQVALDSPPNSSYQLLDANSTVMRSVTHEFKPDASKNNAHGSNNINGAAGANNSDVYATSARQQRLRKVGPFAVDSQSIPDSRIKYAGSWAPPRDQYDDSDAENEPDDSFGAVMTRTDELPPDVGAGKRGATAAGAGDDVERLCDRCSECGCMAEEYNDEEIGLMVIILATFIHREPSLAAPFLPEILSTVSKFATHFTFSWQYANVTHLPGGSQSVAHQFIRCVLHQLAPNGVFVQMFLSQGTDKHRLKYFKSVAKALIDFPELNPASPVHMLVDTLNQKKTLPLETLNTTLRNMGEYLQCVPLDVGIGTNSWSLVVQGVETLFRRLVLHLKDLERPDYLLDIMVCVLKVPGVSKGVLEPFSKVLSHCVQTTTLKHKVLIDLCTLSGRVFSKERDKHQLCRQLVFELVQALKFKSTMPDANLLLLVIIVLQDAGGLLPAGLCGEHVDAAQPLHTSNAADCIRQYLGDILEFLADIHTLSRIKNVQSTAVVPGLGEDTLGATLKGAVAQYLALEMSRGNSKDQKSVGRYLPWLYNAPSSLQQQGFKEYTECVGHMRLLSWVLLGTLTHSALLSHRGGQIGQRGASIHYHQLHSGHTVAQPIPQEASCHIAEHIQVIFTGFADQWKSSVQLMSSLFNAFTLCLLWTVYLEQLALTSPSTSEPHNVTMGILFEFWAKITPSILQLAAFSQSFSEMVNLHFISLLEDLKETRSTVLVKLLPLWSPILSCKTQLSGTLHVRLQNCRDCTAPLDEQEQQAAEKLLKWLRRLQFKMGQIEVQSSTATQFYSI